jgi:putative transposase
MLLEGCYVPAELRARMAALIDYENHERYHESLDNMTPADAYFGRRQTVSTAGLDLSTAGSASGASPR